MKERRISNVIVLVFFCFLLILFAIMGLKSTAKKTLAIPDSGSFNNTFRSRLREIVVEKPSIVRNIAIFPLCSKETNNSDRIKPLTLDEAMEREILDMRELDNTSVNKISVRNHSQNHVFIMAGEILTGSKQDRILKDDILLPPQSGPFSVEAYCVERGRWEEATERFTSKKSLSNIGVRKSGQSEVGVEIYASDSQGRVWSSVDAIQGQSEGRTGTQALHETYEVPKVKKNIDELYRHFEKLPERHRDMNGVAVALGDTVLCLDMTGDRELFMKLWPKLLKSYLLESLNRSDGTPTVKVKDVKSVLVALSEGSIRPIATKGAGELLQVGYERTNGTALVFQSRLVHAGCFPEKGDSKAKQTTPFQRRY